MDIIKTIFKEIDVTWRIIKNDYNTTLIPITTYFIFSYCQRLNFTFSAILSVFVISITYGISYIVPFCISNQVQGIEEDKLEKPYRPLACGLITINGAIKRYLIWSLICMCLSWKMGVMKWSGLWIMVTIFHNFLGGDKNFLTKNVLCMTLGTAAQFGAAWGTFHLEMSQYHQLWMWVTSIWIGVMANIQDFRDIEGDLKSHRRTLPIIFGIYSRPIMSVITIFAGLILCKLLYQFKSYGLAIYINIGIFIWHLVLAGRILLTRCQKSDNITYKYHLSFMYCTIVMSSFIFLKNPIC